jgi:hypothetical protein
MLGLFGPKSDKIELYRAAILYLDPLKESVSTESRAINDVVLGTSVDISSGGYHPSSSFTARLVKK